MNTAKVLGAVLVFANMGANAFAETLSHYRFESQDTSVLNVIADRFEIIARSGHQFEVLVPKEMSSGFLQSVPSAELLAADVNAEFRSNANFGAPKGYRDLQTIASYLQDLAKKYPTLARVEQYGTTESGLPLLLLKISDNVGEEEGEPRVIVDAGTHGDEPIGVEVLLRLVDELLQKYDSSGREKAMVDDLDITFIPVVNPEGYSRFERYSGGVDPNRDYPWPERPEKKSVACIAALRNLFAKNVYSGSFTLHAYGKLIMYPWAYTKEPISDANKRAEMEGLTTLMAQENGYVHGPIATTIYVAKGSSSDYYFWKHNTVSVAMELGRSKAPPASDIPKSVNESRESVFRFLEHFAWN